MLLLVLNDLSINYRDFENSIVDHIALPIIIYDLYPCVCSVLYLCIYTSNTYILTAVDSYNGPTVLFCVPTLLVTVIYYYYIDDGPRPIADTIGRRGISCTVHLLSTYIHYYIDKPLERFSIMSSVHE